MGRIREGCFDFGAMPASVTADQLCYTNATMSISNPLKNHLTTMRTIKEKKVCLTELT